MLTHLPKSVLYRFKSKNKNNIMIKRRTSKNGRKTSTFVKNREYIIAFTQPSAGVKDVPMVLNVEVNDPLTGRWNRVKLDGRAVALLRTVIAK